MWWSMGMTGISVKSCLAKRPGPDVAGCLAHLGGYFGRTPSTPHTCTQHQLMLQVLSVAPKGSYLLSCLPPAKRTHEGLVFFTALTRIFPRMWLSCRFLYCLSLFRIFGNCGWGTLPSCTTIGVLLGGDTPAAGLQQCRASPQPNPVSCSLLFTFLQPVFNPGSSSHISTNSS